jgi:hypothetical protein
VRFFVFDGELSHLENRKSETGIFCHKFLVVFERRTSPTFQKKKKIGENFIIL